MKYGIPTARTSGSANGSLMSGRALRVASARDAATMVAVAPTLDDRSQLSSSVRCVIALLPPGVSARMSVTPRPIRDTT